MDFVGKRRYFFLVSLAVLLPGIVYLIMAPGLNTGIDFTGGSSLTLDFAADVTQEDLRAELAELGHGEATVQEQRDIEAEGEINFFIRVKLLEEEGKDELVEGLKTALSPDGLEILSFDLVSPVVAQETVVSAMWAVLAAAVGIFLYIWWAFRSVPSPFRYGIAAIVALLHDTAIVLGIFAILGEVADIEVNTMFLIALLTVIGYSVNDTIVVFDRVRENVMVHSNRSFSDVVNLSISETIGRSLNTSLTLLFTLLALYLFGGSTIQNFLLVLLIGVVAGTYSSIAIASQVLIAWEYGDVGRLFRRVIPSRSGAR